MYWSSRGFEEDTKAALISTIASWHVDNNLSFADEGYITKHLSDGEKYLSNIELKKFNSAIKVEIEKLKDRSYARRSYSQKHSDYMSDCADYNWKERD